MFAFLTRYGGQTQIGVTCMPIKKLCSLCKRAIDVEGKLAEFRSYLEKVEDDLDSNLAIGHFVFVRPSSGSRDAKKDITEVMYLPTKEKRTLPYGLHIPQDEI